MQFLTKNTWAKFQKFVLLWDRVKAKLHVHLPIKNGSDYGHYNVLCAESLAIVDFKLLQFCTAI